jgi:peptidoglycan/LPS O-acetylase OafA/YrhL
MEKRLSEFDALRGIAALSVVIFHFNCSYMIVKNSIAQGCIKFGATGVNLFFMISGFVILLTLENTKSWKDFLVRRFARLYPTYWVCVTITTLTLAIYFACNHRPYSFLLHQYLPNLTMFQHYFNVPDTDDVYWTLIVEILFYGFMLFLFCIKKLKQVEYIAVITMLPIFIYSSKYFQIHFAYDHHLLLKVLPIINNFPLFVMGIIYYRMKFDKPTLYRYMAILICILCQVSLFGNGLNIDLFLSFKDYILITVFYNVLFILYLYGHLSFIVNKVTLFAGYISYPLYLIHYYISVDVIIPMLLSFKVPLILALAIAFTIVVLLAILLTKFVERPCIRFFKTKLNSKYKNLQSGEYHPI